MAVSSLASRTSARKADIVGIMCLVDHEGNPVQISAGWRIRFDRLNHNIQFSPPPPESERKIFFIFGNARYDEFGLFVGPSTTMLHWGLCDNIARLVGTLFSLDVKRFSGGNEDQNLVFEFF